MRQPSLAGVDAQFDRMFGGRVLPEDIPVPAPLAAPIAPEDQTADPERLPCT